MKLIKRFLNSLLFTQLNIINLAISILILVANTCLYARIGSIEFGITMIALNVLLFLMSVFAFKSKIPFIYSLVGLLYIPVHFITSYADSIFYYTYLFPGIIIFILGIAQSISGIKAKVQINLRSIGYAVIATISLASAGIFNVVKSSTDLDNSNYVKKYWSVPTALIDGEAEQKGNIQSFQYNTKAYATDNRDVAKKANVYIPYNYDESKQYDVLYLMHGTGDNEDYWFINHPENKNILDKLIELKIIKPLIVVTPSWHTENDCSKNLDRLTYTFTNELRDDLMPFVESRYSTYASSTSKEDFILSRKYRGFAGLSRGAMTMYHAALCDSLDYFSIFGGFSGTWTPVSEFKAKLQSEKFKDYSIDYLYASAGTLDFAMPTAAKQYKEYLKVEPRLVYGSNTCFDSFYFKMHLANTWTLSFYNFLLTAYCL